MRFASTKSAVASLLVILGAGTGAASPDKRPRVAQVSTRNAPSARAGHTAVWTGSEMIVWGGDDSLEKRRSPLSTGGRYDPQRNAWHPTAAVRVPRTDHTAVWTGRDMLVWGGEGESGPRNDGAAYDPKSDRWTEISEAGAPSPRRGHVAFWTGDEMLVWGGESGDAQREDGGLWHPTKKSWRPISHEGSPSGRLGFAAVWTGQEMLIWGGKYREAALADGAAYDPATNRWRPILKTGAPSARVLAASAWTGKEMLIWGGRADWQGDDLTDGAAYDPKTGQWRRLSSQGAVRRGSLVGVWTGKAFLTVGEASYDEKSPDQEGGILKPQGDWMSFHVGLGWRQTTVVWTGKAAVVWGGFNGTNVENRGFRILP